MASIFYSKGKTAPVKIESVKEMPRPIVACFLVFLLTISISAGQTAGIPFRAIVPEISKAEQLIVSVASDWSATEVTMYGFDRADTAGPWHLAISSFPAVCGRCGLAWGIGLQGGAPQGEEQKKEGDGKSPCTRLGLSSNIIGRRPPGLVPASFFTFGVGGDFRPTDVRRWQSLICGR